jgi:hypothetical protein
MGHEYCSGLVPHSFLPGSHSDSLATIGATLYFLMGFLTLVFIQYGKYAVKRAGEEGKVRSILFPAFEYCLYLQAVVSVYTGVVIILVPIDPGEANSETQSLIFASVWALQHGVVEGLAILLNQNGCGRHALLKCVFMSLVWCGLCFILYVLFFEGGSAYAVGQLSIDFLLLVYYGLLTFIPQQMVHRRPALMIYAKSWLLFRVFGTALHIGLLTRTSNRLCSCAYFFFRIILFCFFQPILSYEVLLLDTEWWQGLSPRPPSLRLAPSLAPNEDVEFSISSAQTLAEVMDQLNDLDGSLFLNHALVSSRSHALLGDGSFSQVVKGRYLQTPVAIKTIYTQDLTVEVIHKIAAEAKILSLLRRSPHVVFIHGLVLSPPSICIVLELCAFGSLNNVLRGYEHSSSVATPSSEEAARRTNSSPPLYSTSVMRTPTLLFLPPLALCVPDLLFLALGAARGVHAIHSFSPLLCHRDIKSFNFLVSAALVVKIADLELGLEGAEETPLSTGCRACCRSWWRQQEASDTMRDPIQEELLASTPSALEGEEAPLQVHPSVLHMQATWLAPEVIPTGVFSQASDIYSLALVLWEIRTKRYPYSHCSHLQTAIRRAVAGGYRETFPLVSESDPCAVVLLEFDEMVRSAWDSDPQSRPSCVDLVRRLERLVRTCAAESLKAVLRTQRRHERKAMRSSSPGGRVSSPLDVSIGGDVPSPLLESEPPPPNLRSSLAPTSQHLFSLLESHGGEWVVVSAIPPHPVLHITASWHRSLGRVFPLPPPLSRSVSFAALLGPSTATAESPSPFPMSSFLASSLDTGHGHAIIVPPLSPRPSLSLHSYLLDPETVADIFQAPSSQLVSVIAVLFSNLTPREELSQRTSSRAPRLTWIPSSPFASQSGGAEARPSDRESFDSIKL